MNWKEIQVLTFTQVSEGCARYDRSLWKASYPIASHFPQKVSLLWYTSYSGPTSRWSNPWYHKPWSWSWSLSLPGLCRVSDLFDAEQSVLPSIEYYWMLKLILSILEMEEHVSLNLTVFKVGTMNLSMSRLSFGILAADEWRGFIICKHLWSVTMVSSVHPTGNWDHHKKLQLNCFMTV